MSRKLCQISQGRMYIGGQWVAARSGATREIENPFDAKPIAEVAEGDRDDARAAIAAARVAFDSGPWPHTAPEARAERLEAIADILGEQREELARLETLDTGKTLEESRWDIDDVVGVFRWFAGLARTELGDEALSAPSPDAESALVREPVGVCGQILPWNYPLLQAAWKIAPALAAGNTIVVKPSEITPLTTLRLTELVSELDLPPGVFNTVLGPGPTVGAELAESDDVDLISFTGGVATGKAIMRAAAGNVKRVALELGGKNPHIVFADADLESAVDYALNGVFFHAGQICSAGARLLVEEPIYERFVAALRPRLEAIAVGNGLDPATRMGPLISAAHRQKVEAHVEAARAGGATILCGGARPSDAALARGHFYQPTLIVDCPEGLPLLHEEVFGPVISAERFSDEAEVCARANATIYGLSAGFWTRDEARIERVSRALRFGTVWVNDFNVYFAEAPWGGYKQSGFGRELGRAGLDEYLELKHVYRNRSPRPLNWFSS
jgi:betaine-aldehyde dehydrogenase